MANLRSTPPERIITTFPGCILVPFETYYLSKCWYLPLSWKIKTAPAFGAGAVVWPLCSGWILFLVGGLAVVEIAVVGAAEFTDTRSIRTGPLYHVGSLSRTTRNNRVSEIR